MGKKTKTTLPLLVLALTVFVAGCSFSKTNQDEKSNVSSGSSSSAASANVSPENASLPKPTGKVDDVTGAIMDDANKEEGITSSETDSAKSAVSSDQDINDISNSYDKNAL